ncbi:MAG: tetratricopeptide (TPR) repeat protein [Planctomycetota bacterium]|jgi:tetratricopeptide (TPR) repeat protein
MKASTNPESAPTGASQRRWKRDLVIIALMVLGLFGALEGSLRLLGIGADTRTSPLAYQEVFTPAMRPVTSPGGEPFWRTWDPRHPRQFLPRTKAANALRVLCFGGSATAGLGFSPNVTFARQLEDLLIESYPERTIEVVNLGVVAIAAKQVRILLEDALATLEPDLVLVWSGNNEFLPVHHAKYAARHATWSSQLTNTLSDTNLVRLIKRAVHGPPSPADVPDRNPDQDPDKILTQANIIKDVRVEIDEFGATLDAYESELNGMVRAAQAAGVPMVLASVAVNEEWRGRGGLEADWLATFFEQPATLAEAAEQLIQRLTARSISPYDRWDLLTRLASAQDELGQTAQANASWHAALQIDPHLRRATDAHAAAASRAASTENAAVVFLDGRALLRADDPRGRVGFRHFYDYVHFTPRGAMLVADGMLQVAAGLRGFPAPEGHLRRDQDGLPVVLAERLARIEQATGDFTEQDEFLGITFDPARVHSTDLWKYDLALEDLEARLAAHPDDIPALLYRACARSFLQDGAPGARADWEHVLSLQPSHPIATRNLNALR